MKIGIVKKIINLKMESPNPNVENKQNEKEKIEERPQNEKKKTKCISIICWILQVIIWIGAIGLLYIDFYEKSEVFEDVEYISPGALLIAIFEGIFYIWYVILQFCSPTFSFLIHKRSDSNIFEKMKTLFHTYPTIQFVCECYHYETKVVVSTDSNGHVSTRTETVRVVTLTATKIFNYYSSRDVSGLFKLNYDKSVIKDKFYVKLELLTNIDFADAVTYSDYVKERDEFQDENRHYDTFMDFYQNNIINGLTSYNLINLTKNNPCGMSFVWFIFFTLIGFAQPYKVYINSKCLYKSFTIRKLISTRYSLDTIECDQKYSKFNPVISFQDETIQLSSNKISHISEDFEQKLPTQEEIELAQKYQNKVFDFDDKKDEVIILKDKIVVNEEYNSGDNNGEENDDLKKGFLNE